MGPRALSRRARDLRAPTDEEVGAVLTTIYVRVCRLLRRQGFDATAADLSCTDPVAEESPMLAGISRPAAAMEPAALATQV